MVGARQGGLDLRGGDGDLGSGVCVHPNADHFM